MKTIYLCPACHEKMRNGDFAVLQERYPSLKGTVCGRCGAQSTPRHDENAPLHPDEDEQRLVRVLARAREGLLLDERALFDDYLKGLTAGLKNAEEAIVALSRALDVTSEEAAATKKKLDAVGRLIDVELRPGGGFSVTIAGDPLCWYFTPEEAEEEAAPPPQQDRGEARVKTLREIPRAGRQYLRRRLLDGRNFAENELRNLIPPNARRYEANLRARIAACDAVLAQLDEAEGKTRTTAAGDEQAPRQLSLFETLLREGRAKGTS